MKEYQLNYLKNFKCIADKCKHTCCAGWEIAIDKKTAKLYKKLARTDARFKSDINYKIKKFILKENKRCPFLNQKGLCDIISQFGEKNICQVCTDHPRFRSFFSGRVETGLGLSCEQAVRVVLGFDEEIRPVCDLDGKERLNPFEKELLQKRKELIDILYSSGSLTENLSEACRYINTDVKYLSPERFKDELLNTETLDASYKNLLNQFFNGNNHVLEMQENFERPLTQFAVNLIYRHVSGALDLTEFKVRTAFCVLSVNLIKEMLIYFSCNIEELYEIVRAYSAETEYSQENLDALYSAIEDKTPLYLI